MQAGPNYQGSADFTVPGIKVIDLSRMRIDRNQDAVVQQEFII